MKTECASPDCIDFGGDAVLADLLAALAPHAGKELAMRYGGRTTGGGYHLTEVKAASLAALDCGSKLDHWQETILQIEDLPLQSPDRPMSAGKFAVILGQVAGRLPLAPEARLTFEMGQPDEAMRVFDVASLTVKQDRLVLDLMVRPAICKPRHRLAQQSAGVSCCAGEETRAACCS